MPHLYAPLVQRLIKQILVCNIKWQNRALNKINVLPHVTLLLAKALLSKSLV